MPLVLFEGGPLDGYVYETATLLAESQPVPGVHEYNWTSERRTSERTGSVAQVWRHHSLYSRGDDRVDPSIPAPTPAPSRGSERNAAVNELQTAVNAATTAQEDTDEPVVGVVSTPAPEVPAAATEETPAAERGARLAARRKALRWSRDRAKEVTGLPTSRIWGMETGKGQKLTDDDYRTYEAALTQAEGLTAGGDAGGRG